MLRRLVAVAVIAMLACPAGAAAQGALPPGDSGVDEYVEGVPGPKGSVPSGSVGKGKDRGDKALPPGVVRQLEALGEDGRAAAELAEATAPSRADRAGARKARDGEAGGSSGSAGGGNDSGGSAIAEVVGKMVGGGEGGMGLALPLILLVTVLSAIAVVVARRSRGAGQR
jgi:hypothetical protein